MVHTLNCGGRLLTLDQPLVMGILNATPDSFFTKGKNNSVGGLLDQAAAMLQAGASILDIGGVSTRPKADPVSEQEELDRVVPVIEAIYKAFPEAVLSVDTYRATVAREAVAKGAAIVNDISGGTMDEAMFQTIGDLKVSYILTHIQGTPSNMQQHPEYDNVLTAVMDFFTERITTLEQYGVKDIVLDVGFGFGKTMKHNYTLLKHMEAFRILNKPVLMGVSRKSMIYRALDTDTEHALNGTSVLHAWGLSNGADILRVHDVREAAEVVKLYHHLQQY
ncbi:dihydropteroate synthase [Edaphocola flava]|uniref:dihydropteroate synthase n=1 Tax=Edaphocola flava TaxID=2499629 RepID=UPI00100B5C23|nr:dihydropteroate synthase [Edaphocola flava]